MNDIIVEETGLPLRFPDPREQARARAEEFRRLTSEERWREIIALMALGLNMVHSSPHRTAIESRWEAQETEWQQIQKRLLANYAK
jgi:hypothetical protein